MPYIIRCHVKDTAAVKKAIRAEIMFRGDFAPWNEDADDRWFDLSSDQAPLARQLLTAARQWVVACYDGARWLVPTVEGWREQEVKNGRCPRGSGSWYSGHCPAPGAESRSAGDRDPHAGERLKQCTGVPVAGGGL